MDEKVHLTRKVLSLLREAGILEQKGLPLRKTLMQLDISEATYLEWRKADEASQSGLSERIEGLEREIVLLHKVIEHLSVQLKPSGKRSQARL